ncbi:TldD/PmbA family protein [Paracraurococcus lichenis]|uniref:TldD/PmbA family protein n=1 Tax=Paracraurococcus lichenis TaxID=3064888 RepID=A0ABT9E220_9PROT|nr:TldD/PmbA family protein [Paracraurococcus sp. LOR1-02]MDO9710213.1 TldD/PmbA family protein [Paracraurococcus sp. LOR1-02]
MSHVDTLQDLVAAARKAGADAADAILVSNASLSVSRRLGKIEQLERAEGFDLGLRVFVGQGGQLRQAIVSSTDPSPKGFAALAERAVAMARVVPEDPFTGLADAPDGLTTVDLDLADAAEPTAEDLIARAAAAEEAALAVQGVTNSEGAEAGWGRYAIALAASNGFAGEYVRTSHSVSVTALAGQGTGMERDYDYSSTVHLADLEDAAMLGRRAAEKAVARLNPRRPKTARIPVVYDPRVAASLLGHLTGAINGAAVARGTSFLRDKLGQRVMAAGLTLVDDPTRRRGLRSRPFDGEGMQGTRRAIVEDGILTTWVLDWRSARQLGMVSTGHASRGTGGPPSPSTTNLWLEPGRLTPEALMADIREGLYVTELIGMGVNGVTGDYSRGAAGFMIRDGALAEPVSEITIAGNVKDMLLELTPADDLQFRRGTDSPTIRVEGLTMAGG